MTGECIWLVLSYTDLLLVLWAFSWLHPGTRHVCGEFIPALDVLEKVARPLKLHDAHKIFDGYWSSSGQMR